MKMIDIPPLITVWLHVRVLPGPPLKSITCRVFVSTAIGAPHQTLRLVGHRSTQPPSNYRRRFDLTTAANIVLAAGGVTYPLYLLHMQLGYVIFTATDSGHHADIVAAIIIVEAVFLAWVIWRFSEQRTHSLIRFR